MSIISPSRGIVNWCQPYGAGSFSMASINRFGKAVNYRVFVARCVGYCSGSLPTSPPNRSSCPAMFLSSIHHRNTSSEVRQESILPAAWRAWSTSQRCFGTAVRKPARCGTLGTALCQPEGSRYIPPGEIPGSTQDSFPPLRLGGKTTRPPRSSPQ